MADCLIIGGGVIGLSLAYELAGHGARVRVIDATQPAREASWAGAGILPPAHRLSTDPLEQLTALSNRLHERLAPELSESTGIDTGYRRSGAIYLARHLEDADELELFAEWAATREIICRQLSRTDITELEPELQPRSLESAYHVPDERQIRNPRHLKALLAGCAQRKVEISAGVSAEDFVVQGERVVAVRTNMGPLSVDRVCLTTGSWTAALAEKLGAAPAIVPIRGQMALLTLPSAILRHIINEGSRYLVPRCDGRLLAGSTEEDVGFDRGTTAGGIAGLLQLALSLVPRLAEATIERTWSGLRPATRDRLPYLGRAGDLENAFVAAGHFRSGLQLSTGTARVMSQLIRGETPEVDLEAFRLDRDRVRQQK